jgi:flagellar biogenesis protein FliO
MQNYLSIKTNPPFMSFNTELYEGSVQEPTTLIWVKLIVLLTLFLIMPYLYVRFVEWRLLKFIEVKLKRQKNETS